MAEAIPFVPPPPSLLNFVYMGWKMALTSEANLLLPVEIRASVIQEPILWTLLRNGLDIFLPLAKKIATSFEGIP